MDYLIYIAFFGAFSSSRSLEKVDVWAPLWTRLNADCQNLAQWNHVHIIYWAEKQGVSPGRLSNSAGSISSWGVSGDHIPFKSDWVKDSTSVFKVKHNRSTLHLMQVNFSIFFLSHSCWWGVLYDILIKTKVWKYSIIKIVHKLCNLKGS